jgi:hypothetical protein
MLLGPQRERINVDTSVRSLSVVLERLNKVEVSAFTLRETILAVKLELSGDNGVLTPAVKVKRSLREDESTGIRNTRVIKRGVWCSVTRTKVGLRIVISAGSSMNTLMPPISIGNINGTCIGKETRSTNVGSAGLSESIVTTEGVDGIGKSVNGISVVEGLGTKEPVEKLTALKRRAVVNVLIGLDNPDKLLNRVVKVELDLVGRRADGLVTGELQLLNKILVGVLGHASALIGVQKDIVDIERGSNERLVVSSVDAATGRRRGRDGSGTTAAERADSPQALIDGADIEVDLNLVILKSDQRKSKTGVTAIPELEGDVKGGLGESIAGGAHLTRGVSLARTINGVKRGIGDKGELGGVSNHGVVTLLLVNGESKVVPDVHPVTILAINALTTDLNLNLGNQLLTGEIKPTGINTILRRTLHGLVNLGESNLKVSAVSQITITRDGASHAATEIGLSVKSLLDGLHSKVSVTFVRHLPEGNLGVARKINILGAVSDELHKTSCHF